MKKQGSPFCFVPTFGLSFEIYERPMEEGGPFHYEEALVISYRLMVGSVLLFE